jgi:FkbM family methyltransferase
MADISVVVPTKDRLPYLRKAIPMFLAQAEVKEVVVVVDGCSDGTLEYVKAASAGDPRIRYVDNVANKGLPYSRNRGLAAAECEYAFTGEDDLEMPDGFFATLLAHMAETGADIISGRNVFRGERETAAESVARTDRIPGPAVDRRLVMVHPDMNTPGDQAQPLLPAPMLARTDIFRKVLFDDQYRGNAWREESDFQLSAYEAGCKLVFCPHAMTFNVEIENDRGGVHATWGFKRVGWVVRNNWRFVQKHRELIAREFDAGNLHVYIAKFAVSRALSEVIEPQLVELKRRIFGAPRRRGASKLSFSDRHRAGHSMAGDMGRASFSARLATAVGLVWGCADHLADGFFRYVGAFGLGRGPLLYLLSAACPPLRGRLCKATVPGSRTKVLLRLGSSDISVFNGIFRWREYGWDLDRQPRTIIDGGAYIGLSAIYFTMRYPGVRVVAVEASERNFALLVRNTSAFPNIEPVHAALWPQPGSLVLTDPGTGLWGLQVKEALAPDGAAGGGVAGEPGDSVRAITIDDIIRDHGLGRVDLLKVDIEGAEKELFTDPGPWLAQVDAICVELHDWFKVGCTRTFFAAVEDFSVEAWRGENVLVARA